VGGSNIGKVRKLVGEMQRGKKGSVELGRLARICNGQRQTRQTNGRKKKVMMELLDYRRK
jgi:hypothetical protein